MIERLDRAFGAFVSICGAILLFGVVGIFLYGIFVVYIK